MKPARDSSGTASGSSSPIPAVEELVLETPEEALHRRVVGRAALG